MNILSLFAVIAANLIPTMCVMLAVALVLRFIVYRSGKRDNYYFKSFSDTVVKILENEAVRNIENIPHWVEELLHKVANRLPDRSVRANKLPGKADEGSFRNKERLTFEEFANGKRSIIHSVRQNTDAFVSPHPPNFYELTLRILGQDKKWTTILGFVNLDKLSRMLDILPGMFIVFGIFGTFLGITAALPAISQIDLNNIQEATPILNTFVGNVAFSMHTSIFGIICSLILTVLNTIYPITDVRIQVRKNLEYCFEFMWYKIHGEKISEGDRQIIGELKKIRLALEKSQGSKPRAS